jgi:hypothetical protein
MQNHAKKWFENTNANAMTAIVISAILISSVAGMKAFGDNLDADSVETNTNSVTIQSGESTDVKYWIAANSGDGETGCNAKSASPAKVTINAPSGVEGSPGELTFTACGTSSSNFQTVSFTSSEVGTYTITASVSDNGPGTYNTNPARITLTVEPKADTTAPTISISSPNDGDTVTKNSFTVSGTASDSGSGLEKVEVKIDSGSYSTATGTDSWSFDVTNLEEGLHTITAKATDKAGNSATESIEVTYTPPDTTAPILNLPADITAEATGADGAEVSYTVTATDDRDPSPSIECTPASGSTFPLGTTKVDCSATDSAGNKATGSFNVIVRDTTAPILNLPADITAEATGADGAAVTYTATATDAVDGTFKATCTSASGETFAFGSTTVDCSATDSAGNKATGSFNVKVVDTTPPVLNNLPDNIIKEATGASGAAVTYTAPTATDLVDGSVPVTCTPASGSTFSLGETTVNCSAEDTRGNKATGSFTIKVQDTTPPVIKVNSAISDGQQFYFGDVPSAPTCEATDTASGVNSDGCKVSGYGTAVGSYTLIFTATDNAGNKATQQIAYTVLAWTIKGFYSPVDMNGVLNTVKGGSTVPLKFEVFKGSTEITATSAIVTPLKASKVACDGSATLDEIEILSTGGTNLRYDSTAGQFIYNWQTLKKPGECYNVRVGTQDGSFTDIAEFKLK